MVNKALYELLSLLLSPNGYKIKAMNEPKDAWRKKNLLVKFIIIRSLHFTLIKISMAKGLDTKITTKGV